MTSSSPHSTTLLTLTSSIIAISTKPSTSTPLITTTTTTTTAPKCKETFLIVNKIKYLIQLNWLIRGLGKKAWKRETQSLMTEQIWAGGGVGDWGALVATAEGFVRCKRQIQLETQQNLMFKSNYFGRCNCQTQLSEFI